VTTADGATPIVSLDGEPLGKGRSRPLTVRLQDWFWAVMDERRTSSRRSTTDRALAAGRRRAHIHDRREWPGPFVARASYDCRFTTAVTLMLHPGVTSKSDANLLTASASTASHPAGQ
jgi:hypothetical protein